ncbi:unnamed protein product [Prunus armeniaca]|nr:hypothetical protein GBA52_009845 [Prunus armeniaca]
MPSMEKALKFDRWVKEALLNGRYDDVNHCLKRGPHAKMAHPNLEHFYPLLVAVEAAVQRQKQNKDKTNSSS